MTDICIVAMRRSNDVPDAPGRWLKGEIVNVYRAEKYAPASHDKFACLLVTGCPYEFKAVKARLLYTHLDGPRDNPDSKMVSRREFLVPDVYLDRPGREITWRQLMTAGLWRKTDLVDKAIRRVATELTDFDDLTRGN